MAKPQQQNTGAPSIGDILDQMPPLSNELKRDAYDRIVLARTALMVKQPFFGVLSTKLIPVENDTWCKTMAVDGKHLYYNPRFVQGYNDYERSVVEPYIRQSKPDITDEQLDGIMLGLTDANMVAVICHEILHCAFNHFIRRGARDPRLYNIAADYAINQIIKREKIGTLGTGWLYDERFDSMTAEEIYEILLEESKNNPDLQQGDTIDQHMGAGNQPQGKKRGKAGDFMKGQGDQEDGNQSGQGSGDSGDDPDNMPDISSDEMEEYMNDFAEDVRNAAKFAGKAPAEIERMIEEFTKPKIDWRQKIDRTLRSFIRNDCTYMIPSRRSHQLGVIIPGLKPLEEIDVCVAIDTSGSISTKMLQDFISEVYGMAKQFSQFKITLVCFDTNYYNPKQFDENNIETLLEYELAGFGGTDFMAVWDFMQSEKYVPKQLIMFTDGYPCGDWGIPEYCKTLFVLHGTETIVAPFGETTYYPKYDNDER